MKPTQIHETIAFQIDNQKPAHLKPGIDIGLEVIDATTVGVLVVPTGVRATVKYNEGRDLYEVEVERDGERTAYDDVYCDMLGDLIFGNEAEPASFPMVEVWAVDPTTGDLKQVI